MSNSVDREEIAKRLVALPTVGRITVETDDNAVWTAWNEIATRMKIPIYTRTVPGGFEVWRRQ